MSIVVSYSPHLYLSKRLSYIEPHFPNKLMQLLPFVLSPDIQLCLDLRYSLTMISITNILIFHRYALCLNENRL